MILCILSDVFVCSWWKLLEFFLEKRNVVFVSREDLRGTCVVMQAE